MFDPSLVEVGENSVTCTYSTQNGCSKSSEIVLEVLFTPEASFAMSSSCIVEGGTEISFTNLTGGKIDIESWSWDFGDPASGEDNESDRLEPKHFYETAGQRNISLTATTAEGCVDEYVMDVQMGVRPVADFTWVTDCYVDGENSLFLDRSEQGSANLNSFKWAFLSSEGELLDEVESEQASDTVRYGFDAASTFEVMHWVANEDGCADSISREVMLRPTIALSMMTYEEDFNATDGDWTVHSDSTATSWTWETPNFSGFVQNPSDHAWFTKYPLDVLVYQEASWVQSPCFDFRETQVPMISVDFMRSFVANYKNGTVLQYQDVVEDGWHNLGEVNSGVSWYDTDQLQNPPGGSMTGWGLEVFNPDTDWITGMHALDEVRDKAHVSFRIALATNGAEGPNQGFAFDNVRIEERTKKVIMEHFTNTSSANARLADDIVDDVARRNPFAVIDLQYHVGVPGFDPMYENNPIILDSRKFALGVPEIPFTVLGGSFDQDRRFNYFELLTPDLERELGLATLEVPAFDVNLEVEWGDNSMTAITSVTSKESYAEDVQLYLAVFEREVTAYTGNNGDEHFRNVVVDMLPSYGEDLGGNWTAGHLEERTYSWSYKSWVEDVEDLAVAAFILDQESKEYLQADVDYKNGAVGMEEDGESMSAIHTYPNPAKNQVFVNLGRQAEADGILELVDMSGQLIRQMKVPAGYQLIRLQVQDLESGMYMFRWMEGNQLKGITKLVKAR
jgi:PKD repeat protein